MNTARHTLLTILVVSALTACGNSGPSGPAPVSTGGGGIACATPLPAEARTDLSVVVPIPTDFDNNTNPATPAYTPQAQTTINFSVLLPPRCPGDHFPVVLQSHGYSGTREVEVGPDGSFDTTRAHFPSINTLVRALPHHGYVVISVDERGHGAAPGQTAQHRARAIDPAAETQDMIAVLDWAHDNADEFFILRESGTGVERDIRVGTIGYSYGGGFEMPLVALDARVDTMIPNGTWGNLMYSLLPGDGVRLGFDSLLCTLAIQGNVNNTPLLAQLCNVLGPTAPAPVTVRTRVDLVNASATAAPVRMPATTEAEAVNFIYSHSARYFETQQNAGQPWGYTFGRGVNQSRLRPISALFVQGNRDTLFNLTDAYFNYTYFSAAGGDVRLMSTEGGHMNPLALQEEGTANCGGISGLDSMLAWFNMKLKGLDSARFRAIPEVCISVADTPITNTDNDPNLDAPTNAQLAAVLLNNVPVGSLTGVGAVPARVTTMTASVTQATNAPVFQPVITITAAEAGAVLAGVPRAERVSVTAGAGAVVTPIAHVGVGIRRGGQTILVDDEVTPFAAIAPAAGAAACSTGPATDHCNNRNHHNSEVLFPGVGERLQVGDVVGLLFYQNHVQHLPVSTGGTGGLPNPYDVTLTNVELPILIPGRFPGSSLSLP